MALKPEAVAFDIIETCFSLDILAERLKEVGLSESSLALWYAKSLRDGIALSACGEFKPYLEVTKGTLEVVAKSEGVALSSAQTAHVLEGLTQMDAHPDLRPALEHLHISKIPAVALSNGSRKSTEQLIERAGLADRFSAVVSVDDVKQWKPMREVYLHAAKAARTKLGHMTLVAAHAWDCQGAKSAGYALTGWVKRSEAEPNPALATPDIQADNLLDLVRHLTANA